MASYANQQLREIFDLTNNPYELHDLLLLLHHGDGSSLNATATATAATPEHAEILARLQAKFHALREAAIAPTGNTTTGTPTCEKQVVYGQKIMSMRMTFE